MGDVVAMSRTDQTAALGQELHLSASEAIVQANKASITEPLPSKVVYLLKTVGPRISAAALGLSDARMLTKWAEGDRPRRADMEHRVEILFEMAYAVAAVYTGAAAASFLRSSQPALDDASPLMLLREAGDEQLPQVQTQLRAATRAFLEG